MVLVGSLNSHIHSSGIRPVQPAIQGLMFLGLLLGSWFAEIFCSGRLSDWIVQKLNKKNEGTQIAERRLWLAYPAAILSASKLLALKTQFGYC